MDEPSVYTKIEPTTIEKNGALLICSKKYKYSDPNSIDWASNPKC